MVKQKKMQKETQNYIKFLFSNYDHEEGRSERKEKKMFLQIFSSSSSCLCNECPKNERERERAREVLFKTKTFDIYLTKIYLPM